MKERKELPVLDWPLTVCDQNFRAMEIKQCIYTYVILTHIHTHKRNLS